MRLLSLEVANYRNITKAELTPGRELTVICGNNGQGKTNLLEAIWLLTGGKSFRGGKDAELVRRGETFAVLDAVTLRAWQEDQERDDPSHVRITVGTPDSQRPGRGESGAPTVRRTRFGSSVSCSSCCARRVDALSTAKGSPRRTSSASLPPRKLLPPVSSQMASRRFVLPWPLLPQMTVSSRPGVRLAEAMFR